MSCPHYIIFISFHRSNTKKCDDQFIHNLLLGLRVYWLHPLQRNKTTPQTKGVLGMTINYISWWGSNSESINPRFFLRDKTLKIPFMGQVDLIEMMFWMILNYIDIAGAHGVMVIVIGNGLGDLSSNPGRADCISHHTKSLRKGMNPIILSLAVDSRTDWVLSPWLGNHSRRRKTLNSNLLNSP